jgi:heat shock protein HslJ
MKTYGFVVFVSTLLLAGCASRTAPKPLDTAPGAPVQAPVPKVELLEELAGTSWIVAELDDAPVVSVEADGDGPDWPPLSLEFTKNGQQASGHSGVNRFMGRCTQNEASLVFGPLAMTRRAGPAGQMALERRYTQVLSSVVGWRQDGEQLVLVTPGSKRAAVLTRANPSPSAN